MSAAAPRALALALAASLVAAPSLARAQSATVQAQSLFDQGRALLERGEIVQACAAFEASQKLEPVVTTLLNLAACREQNDQLATAWGHFIEANRMATAAGNAKLAAVATRHAARIKPTLSQLKIAVADPRAPGLELRRGKEKVAPAAWGFALPVDGGTYTFTAKAAGYRTWTTTITVRPSSENRTLQVPALAKLREGEADVPLVAKAPPGKPTEKPPAKPQADKKPAVAAAAPAATEPAAMSISSTEQRPDPESAPRRSLLLPISFGVGALAFGGAAIGFKLYGDTAYDKADAATTQSVRDAWSDTANTRRHVAIGAAVLAVGCAGTAVYFYVRGKRAPSRSSSEAATAVTVTATPELTGLVVRGGW